MPAPLDLAGQRFGRLVALARQPGSSPARWLCRCDCGADTTVPRDRLSSVADDNRRAVRACEACRSRRCAVCGSLFLTPGSTATCGAEACRLDNRRAVNLLAEHRAEQRVPGLKARRQREYRAGLQGDPVRLAAALERDRISARCSRARRTPEQRAEKREDARLYYAQNREHVRSRFDAWLGAMPPKQRAFWDEAVRAAGRRYHQRRALARLAADAATLLDKV